MDFPIGATGPFWAALRLAHLDRGDSKPAELICPRCARHDCVPSRPAGYLDGLMARHGSSPYQCRACGKRFYYYQGVRMD